MKIYRIVNLAEVEVYELSDKNCVKKTAIMGIDEYQISVVVDSPISFQIGDYLKDGDIKYALNREPHYEQYSEVEYHYDFIFEHPIYLLLDKLYENRLTNQTSFYLTGRLIDFLVLLVWNINKDENPLGIDNGWTTGFIYSTGYKNIRFENLNCREVLDKLAQEFDCEYYVLNKEINFVERVQFETSFVFEQGKEKGLYKLEQQNVDEGDTITRVRPRGGNKNIPNSFADAEGYLKLPEIYLENFSEHKKVVERQKTFEDVFPHFVGSVQSPSGTNNIEFLCPQIDFDINAIAVGDNARINFLSGDLMGISFKFQFDYSTKKITLLKQDDETALPDADGVKPQLPNSTKYAKAGDTFNFTGIIMPQSYVDAAITELRAKAQKWLDFYSKKRVKFSLDIDYRWLRNKQQLKSGDAIVISRPENSYSKLLRVVSIDRNISSGAVNAVVSNYLEERWDKTFKDDLDALKDRILANSSNLKNTLVSIFTDGIVTETELAQLNANLKEIEKDKLALDKTYQVIYNDVMLTGIPKSDLFTAKADFDNSYTALIDKINSVVADGIASETERTEVNNLYNSYNQSLAGYREKEEIAKKSITDAINSTLQNWASDGVISPTEKLAIKQTRQRISIEKQTVSEGANKYALPLNNYLAAWNNYDAVLAKYSADVPENIPVGADFAGAEETYKTEKVAIDNAITNAQKNDINSKQPIGSYLTLAQFNEYFELDSLNNAIKAKKDFYSIGGVSAYGQGVTGGGGSGTVSVYNGLDSLDTAMALSAYQGKVLNDRLLQVEQNGAMNISVTGSGNALTSITKSGNTLTFDKGSIFSLSNHNHNYLPFLDNRTIDYLPFDERLQKGIGNLHLTTNAVGGLSDGGGYYGSVYIHQWGDKSGGPATQLGFTDNNIWFRKGHDSWLPWRKIWDSGNFNPANYLPINGNAVSASNILNTGRVTLGSPTEANEIYISQPSYSPNLPVKLLNFQWYNDIWSLGNIRSGSTPSEGFGLFLNNVEKFRFENKGYPALKVNGFQALAFAGAEMYLGNSQGATYINAGLGLYAMASGSIYPIYHAGNDGHNSGLDADLLDGLHGENYVKYRGWTGLDANTMEPNSVGFTYANNAPYNGPILNLGAGVYSIQFNSSYNLSGNISFRTRNGDINSWNTWYNLKRFTTRDNWSLDGIDFVAGQLVWKNYGNGHTIFDASNGTTPTGTGCDNSNAQIAWSPTYPTLMGYNGINTYGVRVDSARIADYTPRLQTPRTLWGQNFDGTANVFGNLYGVGALVSSNYIGFISEVSGAQRIATGGLLVSYDYNYLSNVPQNGIWSIGDIISATKTKAPVTDFGNGWTIEAYSNELHFKLNGVLKGKFIDGAFVSTGEVTAYA